MSQFGVDGQSVHFETECHSSKLSQQTVCQVDASFGSKCHVVGSWVDGSSRHPSSRKEKLPAGNLPNLHFLSKMFKFKCRRSQLFLEYIFGPYFVLQIHSVATKLGVPCFANKKLDKIFSQFGDISRNGF